jgi:4-hydroxybenzoate polyprenyltransferase
MVRSAFLCLHTGCRGALLTTAYANYASPSSLLSKSTRLFRSQSVSGLVSGNALAATYGPKIPRTVGRHQHSASTGRLSLSVGCEAQRQESFTLAAPYSPPTTGLLSILPSSWVPYAELIRLDKPTGTYYLFFPCLFSTFLAAPLTTPIASPTSVIGTTFLFFSGALIMRGAGCTINDLWDRNLDPHVRRTRLRPIARGAVTPLNALIFTGAQLLTGLAILLQFPTQCLFYGIPSLLLVASYPLAKRVTHYPQVVLGLTFSWGAIMGFPALGVDLLHNSAALMAAGYLYASNIAWTVLYDMIYAHMDIKDDAKAGIKSIALKHDKQTKQILTGLAATQVGLLAAAGVAAGVGPVFFVGSCGGAAATLAVMIWKVNLKSVNDCWWWFVNGCWFTGGAVATGLGAEYLVQYMS